MGRARHGWRWLPLLCALALAGGPAFAQASAPERLLIDTQRSHLQFEVRTRLGQRMQGQFPEFSGVCEVLADGRHRVSLRVATAAAVLPGRARPTAWMRGESFFDATRHPWLEFRSEPYWPQDLARGAGLAGQLSLRGVTREEVLQVKPASCARPGRDCGVEVSGTLGRSDYGMEDWQIVLGEEVRLHMEVWLKENPGP
jgi:polyisoprenoid-binding protein YceI